MSKKLEELETDIGNLDTALNELMGEPGRIAKGDILLKYEDLPYFKTVIEFLYNDFITTGISKKKLSNSAAQIPLEGMTILEDFEDMLQYLKENNTGRLVDVSSVNSFITNFPNNIKILSGIVTKDIPLGVSSSTINQVYGKNFVPKFDVMKAQKFEPVKMVKDNKLLKEYAITEKMDGTRLLALIGNKGEVQLMARSGKPFEGFSELEESVRSLGLTNRVLDGEVVAKNPNNLRSDELFTLTQSISRKKGEKVGLDYWVYDTLTLEDFLEGKSKDTYLERRKVLTNIVKDSEHIKELPILDITTSFTKLQEYMDWATDNHKEGVMLNDVKGEYVTTRTKNILKVKKFHTVDIRCLAVEEEIRGGKLGAIVVDYKGNNVRVGSGFSDIERKEYWEDPSLIVGKIVEVSYFEESKNKNNDNLSLRFPTFKMVRDKDEVSYD